MVKRKPSTLLFNLCSHTKRRVECILFLQEDELCLGNVISGVVYQLSLSSASASREIWYQADGRSMKGGPALLPGALCSGEANKSLPCTLPLHIAQPFEKLIRIHQVTLFLLAPVHQAALVLADIALSAVTSSFSQETIPLRVSVYDIKVKYIHTYICIIL